MRCTACRCGPVCTVPRTCTGCWARWGAAARFGSTWGHSPAAERSTRPWRPSASWPARIEPLVTQGGSAMADQPWWHEGLRFKCSECGDCCTGAPGYVWVNRAEIEALAATQNMDVAEF